MIALASCRSCRLRVTRAARGPLLFIVKTLIFKFDFVIHKSYNVIIHSCTPDGTGVSNDNP